MFLSCFIPLTELILQRLRVAETGDGRNRNYCAKILLSDFSRQIIRMSFSRSSVATRFSSILHLRRTQLPAHSHLSLLSILQLD
jgi:hypothetical protein